MPAFALTPRGAPVTTIRGPAGAAVRGRRGTVAVAAPAAAAAAEPAWRRRRPAERAGIAGVGEPRARPNSPAIEPADRQCQAAIINA